jgi:hypothetical protein
VLLDVDITSVEVPGLAPLIVTVEVLKEQLGAGLPAVVTLHERLTLPVYPFAGPTVTVEVDVFPEITQPGFNVVAVSI